MNRVPMRWVILVSSHSLQWYDRYMFTLCWCDCPNGLSASHHHFPLIRHIQSVSVFLSSHPHAILPSHPQPLPTPLSISPLYCFGSAFHFFDLQEPFDLLTDSFYLYDLAMSFQQHLCGSRGLSSQSAHKKKPLAAGLSPEKYNYPHCFQANTETRSPLTDNVPSSIFLKVPLNYNFALDNETDIWNWTSSFLLSINFMDSRLRACPTHAFSLTAKLHGHRPFTDD